MQRGGKNGRASNRYGEAEHNVINTSRSEALKLYAIYPPPEHLDGTIRKTKVEAEEHERMHHH